MRTDSVCEERSCAGLRNVDDCVLVRAGGLQTEGYCDGFGGFDRLTVERSGLVMPLADGVRGGGDEERWTGRLIDVLDAAVTGDDGA